MVNNPYVWAASSSGLRLASLLLFIYCTTHNASAVNRKNNLKMNT